MENPTSQATILRKQIMHQNHTTDEWISLQDELRAFIASIPSQQEINALQVCGESLAMICNAIKEGKL